MTQTACDDSSEQKLGNGNQTDRKPGCTSEYPHVVMYETWSE